jgi:aryl-alcohol dehydrogenase-like predicted oxidoreductase
MEKRAFGKTDMQVGVLGFGGAEIGFENASPHIVKELLVAAIDQGLNVIDTAECYVGSEELIGNAVSNRRKEFYLFTKCGHGQNTKGEWSKAQITNSIDRSLMRLKTDHLDLVQLHSCGLDILKKGECIEALQEAKKAGKTRYIGYSGDGSDAQYAVDSKLFDALQISVNIADQEPIGNVLEDARKQGMGVIAKRPIANAAWKSKSKPSNSYHVPYWERLQKLNFDFLGKDSCEAISTALRFTLSVPGIDVAIVGTTKPGRWRENADFIASGKLTDKEFAEIRSRWADKVEADWVGQT